MPISCPNVRYIAMRPGSSPSGIWPGGVQKAKLTMQSGLRPDPAGDAVPTAGAVACACAAANAAAALCFSLIEFGQGTKSGTVGDCTSAHTRRKNAR